jgi:hypothetical protein
MDGNRSHGIRTFANPGNFANWADDGFNRADANHDGLLDYNEMPDDLRDTLDTWDNDENGVVDLGEYRDYHVAKIQQRLTEREEEGLPTPWSGRERKPTVTTRNNLPRDLPEWFTQLDENADVQVSFREWRLDKKKSLDEFSRYDRNNDGFLTVEEVARGKSRAAPGGTNGVPVRDGSIVRGGVTPPIAIGSGSGNGSNNANGFDRRALRRGGDGNGERRNWGRPWEGGERRMPIGRPGGGERDNNERRRFGPPGSDRERRVDDQGNTKPKDK